MAAPTTIGYSTKESLTAIVEFLILTDYRGALYSSTTNATTLSTLDVDAVRGCLEHAGHSVDVRSFAEIQLDCDYDSTCVVYTSSEDRGLQYKSYIEDVILFLAARGALVIPDYPLLRAHHNKSFMEMLRYALLPEQARLLHSRMFGTLEDLRSADLPEQPFVVKAAYGAGGKYVRLAHDLAHAQRIAARFSRSHDISDILAEFRRRLLWRGYRKASLHRRKFILQDYVAGLLGDFKVLRYGKRFYTLYRENRPNDFRASGGGRLSYELPDHVDEHALLDFARMVSDRIGSPCCSLDIAFDGNQFFLMEFQCVSFGPYAAEHSTHYATFDQGRWRHIAEKCNLERVFCDAILDYVDDHPGPQQHQGQS